MNKSLWLFLRFFVRRMLPAESAVLLQLQTVGMLFLVLGAAVVNPLAFLALELYAFAHCQFLSSSKY